MAMLLYESLGLRWFGAVSLALVSAAMPVACGKGAQRSSGPASVDTSAHPTSEEARWAALRMTHKQLRGHLGGHRFEARHEVATGLGDQPEQAYTDEYFLECTAQGDCHGRLDNSLEYGVEVVRRGEETFFRHRYQEFLRFVEEQEESERRVEHLWGVGKAVLDLLQPLVRLEPSGELDVDGRRALRYRLQRRNRPLPLPGRGSQARRWRSKLRLESVEGDVVLDLATGAPRRIVVRYRVSAPKGEGRFTLTGSLRAEVKAPFSKPTISAPEHFVEASPRDREALEVRALLGDQRLNPGWFRGGGPHAAREGARRRPSPMPAPSSPGASPLRPVESGSRAAPQGKISPSPPGASPLGPMAPASRATP